MINNQSIKELIVKNQETIAIKAVSEKIYTLMQNIRNGATDKAYQRRWVWELLQNAMDTSNHERNTIVQINLNAEDLTLSFSHNGNPFKVDNITHLVNQLSSKPRIVNINERKRTIGKFGTGFITTHLLAEKVTLISTIDAENCGHKMFEILLDRSGKNEVELYKGVKEAVDILMNLDSLPNVTSYNFDGLNTEFLYHLDVKGINVAKEGIEDLRKCLPFTMAFVKTISEIAINENLLYKYDGSKELAKGLCIHTINISDTGNRYILTLESGVQDAVIALEVLLEGNIITLISTDKNSPKLYCNYPFIGTEEFNIPVVFNSSSFNVYQERRNGIILKDAETREIQENKIIIKECAKLYNALLKFIETSTYEFKETYVLAMIKQPFDYEWLSKKWYELEILKPIQQSILHAAIIEIYNSEKKVSILNEKGGNIVWFPYSKNEKALESLWLLGSNWLTYVPVKSQYKIWNNTLFEGCPKLNITLISNFINGKNLDWLRIQLKNNNTYFKNEIEWLNNFYSIILTDPVITNQVNTNKIAIFPNQKGDFVLKSLLFWDDGNIPDALKDILDVLGNDCRKKLLHYDIFLAAEIEIDKEKLIGIEIIAKQIQEQVAKFNADKMKGIGLAEPIRNIFKDLYLWLVANPNANVYFNPLYKNKETRLLDEETIKDSFERDNKTKEILSKYEIANLEDLENLIKFNASKSENTISSEDLIVSLGITSLEDLEKAKIQLSEDLELTKLLSHISVSNKETLERVLKLIERSKQNVRLDLESNIDYDCSSWEESSLTTITGIKKKGVPIKLVIRPADGNQIILFYPEEYEVLENSGNELWYDNGTEQAIYSFGRFLKRAKVNRMPL